MRSRPLTIRQFAVCGSVRCVDGLVFGGLGVVWFGGYGLWVYVTVDGGVVLRCGSGDDDGGGVEPVLDGFNGGGGRWKRRRDSAMDPLSEHALEKIMRHLYEKHPMMKFSCTVAEDTDMKVDGVVKFDGINQGLAVI
ncbi:hypothetical protein Dsin_032035 [Dipteronia sinensis]|uniref:Uncharacterized protein n=1 Tax=Dipteronia sinensis TaxID=43782 RepID=A0AAD9ZNY3_9ROSI|nr:hypothetical protein Dsin_032035 [Dipteronia sinensis]